jgi:hypothetical protein
VHIDLLYGGADTQLSLTQKACYCAAGCANSGTARTPSPAQQHGGSGLCGRLKSRFCDPFRRCRSITSPRDRAAPAAHRRRLHQRGSAAARRPGGGQSRPMGTWKRSWGCAVPGFAVDHLSGLAKKPAGNFQSITFEGSTFYSQTSHRGSVQTPNRNAPDPPCDSTPLILPMRNALLCPQESESPH